MPTKMLHIPTEDGRADAFAAFPDRGERHPGVLMYADGFGIRPVLQEMARELAGHGYYVLVPNPFYRHGPAPVIELPEHIGEEVRPAIMAQLMPLIEAHTRLDAAAVDYTSEIYPGTVHGFTMSDTDAFNPAALQHHWDCLLPLLDRTLTNS